MFWFWLFWGVGVFFSLGLGWVPVLDDCLLAVTKFGFALVFHFFFVVNLIIVLGRLGLFVIAGPIWPILCHFFDRLRLTPIFLLSQIRYLLMNWVVASFALLLWRSAHFSSRFFNAFKLFLLHSGCLFLDLVILLRSFRILGLVCLVGRTGMVGMIGLIGMVGIGDFILAFYLPI